MHRFLRNHIQFALAILFVSAAVTIGQPLLSPPVFSTASKEAAPADQSTTAASATPAEPVPDKRTENAKLLRLAQRNLESADPSDSAAAQRVAHYQSVDAIFAQQDMVDQQIKDLSVRRQELDQQAKSPALQPAQTGEAYSFVELDRLKDELAAEQAKELLINDRITAAKTAL